MQRLLYSAWAEQAMPAKKVVLSEHQVPRCFIPALVLGGKHYCSDVEIETERLETLPRSVQVINR